MFEQQCPHYMSIGMSYDEFWNQDVSLVKAYRKADELRRRRQNEVLWLQGVYVREALLSTVGNMLAGQGATPIEYPAEPHAITAEQVAEKQDQERKSMERRMKADMAALAARMIKKQQMSSETHPG